jgi:hypothetical protein
LIATACTLLLTLAPAAFGDEGMWLFNNPPTEYLKKSYKFEPTKDWLEHVQKSSVRFNTGGSGSFVSADGLVMTNHHVGLDTLQKISAKGHDYVKDGFYARTQSEEKKGDGLEINVLWKITDVTKEVNAAVAADLPPDKAFAARRKVMGDIEKEASERDKLRSDVVTLYNGAVYHLYQYKKYTDVRLVFAPEQQIAFFGGDPDNFEYPRFDLDVCIFRVYENDKPLRPEHYLKWSKEGAKENELVLVSGHPGRTDRMNTIAELEYLRDVGFPFLMQRLNRLEVLLGTYSGRSEENARIAKELFFSIQNSRKARIGGLAGLQDPAIMAGKKVYEQELRDAAAKDEKLKGAGAAWDKIAAAEKLRVELARPYALLEGGGGFNSELYGIARTIARAADELPKDGGERLREFRDSNLESLKFNLFETHEIHDDFEIAKLTDSLTFLIGELGYKNPLVQKILDGKSPQARAAELVQGTKLKDVELRKKLFEGGAKAIAGANDPMIALALLVDPEARALRHKMETQVEEVKRSAYADIAKVKFALEGESTYPDATFTLRLAFGVVKGYTERGKPVPFETTFTGLYQRSEENNDRSPFDLPKRWIENRGKLDLKIPLNFVLTADIIGGNSGSPVINKDAEVVGLIFDGNIQSLVLDFAYTEEQARAVAVHSSGIIEALRKVYDAKELAEELTTGKSKAAE